MDKKLYLIPTPIIEDGLSTLPNSTIEVIRRLDTFIVENARTARRFIKTCKPLRPIQELNIIALDKHEKEQNRSLLEEGLALSSEIGFMSDAGCPAIADPGSEIVKKAHSYGMKIISLVGPSSIFLALMASGLNGQKFQFHGYLSPKKEQLPKDLKLLEKLAKSTRGTQLFIETPYRNRQMLETAIKSLNDETRFCIAANITAADQIVKMMKIKDWKNESLPEIHKTPCIFLIGN